VGVCLPLRKQEASKWAEVAGGEEASQLHPAISLCLVILTTSEGMEKVGIPIPRARRICHLGDFTVVRFDNYLPCLEVSTHSSRAASATCGGRFGTGKQQSVISCRRCHLSSRVIDPPTQLRASADMHQTSGVRACVCVCVCAC
jgi:hypothetical protein